MADENTEDHLAEGEREFFKSRGETAIPQGTTEEPKTTPEGDPPKEEASGDGERKEQRSAGEGDGDEAGKRKEGTVDRHAFDAERKKRKDAEEGKRQAELLAVRMEERFKAYVDTAGERRGQPQQQQPRPAPKPSEDIFGAVDHTMRAVGEINKKVQEYEQNERNKAKANELVNWGAAHEQAFIQENPDYYDALGHLRQGRARELQAWGLQGMTPDGKIVPGTPIANQLGSEEHQLLMRAANQKVSPAQMAYNLARARGYTKAAAKAQGEDAGKALDRIEAGKKAGSSMAGVGGRTNGSGEVTLADLVAMPESEFAAFKAKNPAKFRRLKGATH